FGGAIADLCGRSWPLGIYKRSNGSGKGIGSAKDTKVHTDLTRALVTRRAVSFCFGSRLLVVEGLCADIWGAEPRSRISCPQHSGLLIASWIFGFLYGIEDRYEQLPTNRNESYETEQQHEIEGREAQAKLVQMKGRSFVDSTKSLARKFRRWRSRRKRLAKDARRHGNRGSTGAATLPKKPSVGPRYPRTRTARATKNAQRRTAPSVDGDELSNAAFDRGDDAGEELGSLMQAEIRRLENRQREEISAQLRLHRAAVAATDAATMRNVTQHREETETIACSHRREAEAQARARNAEARIMLEQRVMSRLLDSVVDGVISITPNGNIVKFHTAAEEMFKYSAKEVLGKNNPFQRLFSNPLNRSHSNALVKHDSYLKRYMKSGVSKQIGNTSRQLGRRKNGEIFPMELSLSEVNLAEYHASVAILVRPNLIGGFSKLLTDT
ncbi:hypothetical protein BDK51DRAFT_26181, partial [Blyttiomyces helicus]